MSPRPGYTKKGYNRQANWRGNAYFAPVSIGNPYTYLDDLHDESRSAWRTAAEIIYGQANNLLGKEHFTELQIGGGSRDGHLRTYSVDDAIQFLTSVANSMKSHEMAYIRKRINDLAQFPGTISQELIDKFNNMNDDNFDYPVFISMLNEVHGKIKLYKKRLEAFQREGHSRNLERDIAGSLGTILSNYTDRRSRFAESQHSIINMLTMRFFQSDQGKDFVRQQVSLGAKGVTNFVAGLALIQRELAQYLTDNGDLIYSKEIMAREELINQIEKLTPKLDEFSKDTNIFAALGNQRLLDDLTNIYGIEITDSALPKSYTHNAKKARDEVNNILKQLNINKNIDNNETFNKMLKRVRVKSGSGLLYIHDEIQSLIISALNGSTHTGGLSMATDLIAFSVSVSDEKEDNNVIKQLQNETDNIIKYIKDADAANDPKKTSKIYAEQLDKLDKICSELERGFIFHETNKLYTSIEGGKGFQKYGSSVAAFSGRNMNLFNYIDSMALFGQELGIDTAWLRFVAFNLAGNALGKDLVGPLEKILAIAAGLIMFDDFAQIAQEASGEIAYSSIENIHLYKLNGFYVPASYFINATLNCLLGLETLSTSDAFFTKIKAPGHVDYDRTHEKPNPTPADWESVRGQASKIDIHLYFGANFLNLVSKLQS